MRVRDPPADGLYADVGAAAFAEPLTEARRYM